MKDAEKHIVNAYSKLFESLSFVSKKKLIEILSNYLNQEKDKETVDFYSSFGAFGSSKSAEEIVDEIKSSGKFNSKEIIME
nr:hypothetical protein [Sphingobacterium hungaricum]